MTSNNPLTLDGKTYPNFSLNLAVTGTYKPDGSRDASIAMRLVPTRIEDGVVETADAQAISVYLGTLANADPTIEAAVGVIESALQGFIDSKGI